MFTTQTHTHTPSHATHTERDLQSRFGKEKLIKRFKLQQKVRKTPKDTHYSCITLKYTCSLYRDIKRTRSEHLVDLFCSLDGVLRVKHSTLVVTRGAPSKKLKRQLLKVVGYGWTQHNTLHFKFTGYVLHPL